MISYSARFQMVHWLDLRGGERGWRRPGASRFWCASESAASPAQSVAIASSHSTVIACTNSFIHYLVRPPLGAAPFLAAGCAASGAALSCVAAWEPPPWPAGSAAGATAGNGAGWGSAASAEDKAEDVGDGLGGEERSWLVLGSSCQESGQQTEMMMRLKMWNCTIQFVYVNL